MGRCREGTPPVGNEIDGIELVEMLEPATGPFPTALKWSEFIVETFLIFFSCTYLYKEAE